MEKLQQYTSLDRKLSCSLYLIFQEIRVHSIEEIYEQIMIIQNQYPKQYKSIILDVGDEMYILGTEIDRIDCSDYKVPREEINEYVKQGLINLSF